MVLLLLLNMDLTSARNQKWGSKGCQFSCCVVEITIMMHLFENTKKFHPLLNFLCFECNSKRVYAIKYQFCASAYLFYFFLSLKHWYICCSTTVFCCSECWRVIFGWLCLCDEDTWKSFTVPNRYTASINLLHFIWRYVYNFYSHDIAWR